MLKMLRQGWTCSAPRTWTFRSGEGHCEDVRELMDTQHRTNPSLHIQVWVACETSRDASECPILIVYTAR
jgi:hypothetical protein